jgi:TRAP-type C4-dicarboxylate transport system permease small subunit
MSRHVADAPRTGWLAALDENAERWLLLGFYCTIVAAIAVEVVRRFVLSYSSIWGEEVARYAFIYLAWVGASAAVRERAHIRIDILPHYAPPRIAAALNILADLCTLALALICVWWSLKPVVTAIEFGSVTHGLRISTAWFLAAVPLGFGLMIVRLGQNLRRDVADLLAGRVTAEPVPSLHA